MKMDALKFAVFFGGVLICIGLFVLAVESIAPEGLCLILIFLLLALTAITIGAVIPYIEDKKSNREGNINL